MQSKLFMDFSKNFIKSECNRNLNSIPNCFHFSLVAFSPKKKHPRKTEGACLRFETTQQMITLIPAFLKRFAYSLSMPLSVSKYLILSTHPREANWTFSSLLESASR